MKNWKTILIVILVIALIYYVYNRISAMNKCKEAVKNGYTQTINGLTYPIACNFKLFGTVGG